MARYVKNTVKGKQKGRAYSEKMKTLCLMELMTENIHEVAQKHRIPESTMRNWLRDAKKLTDPKTGESVWETERRAMIRLVSARAASGASMAVEAAIKELEKNRATAARREELLRLVLDPATPEEQKWAARMELDLKPGLADRDINGYIRTLAGASAVAEKLLGEDGPQEVRVVLMGEVEQYAK